MFTLLFIPPIWLLPIIILILLGGGILFKLSSKDACKIAIFGSKASGKTTLWNQLRNQFEDCNYHPTLGIDDVDDFDIELDGKRKRISKSKDYGGSDVFVKDYEQEISAGTFIYYLIDLTRLDDFKKEEISKRWLSSTKFKKRKDDNYTIRKYRRIRALNEQEILDAAEKELINGDKEWTYHASVVALFYAIKNKNKSID